MSTRTKKHKRSYWRYTKVLQQAFEVYPVYLWVIIAVSLHWRPRYGKNIRVISPCWHWNTNCTLVVMFCRKLNSNPRWTNTRRTLDSSCSLFFDSRTGAVLLALLHSKRGVFLPLFDKRPHSNLSEGILPLFAFSSTPSGILIDFSTLQCRPILHFWCIGHSFSMIYLSFYTKTRFSDYVFTTLLSSQALAFGSHGRLWEWVGEGV